MLRFVSVLALLVLAGAVVQPQDAPKPQTKDADSIVTVLFENLPLKDAVSAIASQLDYTDSYAEDVDTTLEVSLELGRVPAWLAALAIGEAGSVEVRIHPSKKVIEVIEAGGESAHVASRSADFSAALKRAKASIAALSGEGEPPVKVRDPAAQIAEVVLLFFRLANGDDDALVDSEGKLAFTSDEQLAGQISELVQLLGSESGGQSSRLKAQAETWQKLRASSIDVVTEGAPLADLCGYFRAQVNVPVLFAPGGNSEESREPPALSLKGLKTDVALGLVLESYGFGYHLCGNCVFVDDSDAEPPRPQYSGFAVYELMPVLQAQKRRGANAAYVLDDLLTIVRETKGSRSRTFAEIIGTRMVLGGDQQAQQDVEQILRLLTEPPKSVVLPQWPTLELRLDLMNGRESIDALAKALKWQSWVGDTEMELSGRTLRGKPVPAWVAGALLDIASESRVELFPSRKIITRLYDTHALHVLWRLDTAAVFAAETADNALIGPNPKPPADETEEEKDEHGWNDDWFELFERAFGMGLSNRCYVVSEQDAIARLGEVDAARLESLLALLVKPGRDPERAPEYATFERINTRRIDTAFAGNGLDDCVQWLRDVEGLTIFEAPDLWAKEAPKITLALKQATVVEVLDALCSAANIHWQLVHEVVVLYAGSPSNLARHCTCDVYDLRPLVTAQPAATEKYNARRQRLKVIDEAVSKAMLVLPHAEQTNFALIGCRLAICGDARTQAAVLAALKTLGYEQK